jgi:THAP domain
MAPFWGKSAANLTRRGANKTHCFAIINSDSLLFVIVVSSWLFSTCFLSLLIFSYNIWHLIMPGCCAPNCTNSRAKGFYMSKFPTDEPRRSIWVQNIRRIQKVIMPNGQMKKTAWQPTQHTVLCEVLYCFVNTAIKWRYFAGYSLAFWHLFWYDVAGP